jgi:uncharacterized protein (TIGR03067 family)
MFAIRVGLILLAASPALAFAQGDDATKEELKKLQGSWKVTSMIIDGMDQKLPDGQSVVFVIKDATVKQMVGDVVAMEGKFEVNSKANPKQITLIADNGPNKGKKDMAVYILEGDTFKVAGYTGDASLEKRLDAFPKTAMKGVDLFEMKRVK